MGVGEAVGPKGKLPAYSGEVDRLASDECDCECACCRRMCGGVDEPRAVPAEPYGECGPIEWTGKGGELYSEGGGKAKDGGGLYCWPGLDECGEVCVGGEALASMPCS